jgi:replicative DNA helicase
MTLIAGRPSMGKTTFALNMAANIAFRQEIPAAFFSPEVSSRMLTARLLSAESQIDIRTMTSSIKSEREKCFNQISDVIAQISKKPFFIEETPSMNLADICARARSFHQKEKIEIIFIDSIDLLQIENSKAPLEEQQTAVSRSIKELARELNIAIVVMSQMRRSSQRTMPRLSYLTVPSLGIYSDVVLLLHTERNPDPEKQHDIFKTSVTIAKNRNGPTGIIELDFYPEFCRFEVTRSNAIAENLPAPPAS